MLNHPKNWRFFFRHRAATGFAFASASTTLAFLAFDPLWLSLRASDHISFVALDLIGQLHLRLFLTIPSRSSVVI